jgi:uncharacterized membrane protein
VKICWNPIQSSLYTHSILTSVAIYQHHQRMQFTFHHSYVFLELVPSTVILWTELSCFLLVVLSIAMITLISVKQWYILRSKVCWQTVHHNVGWRTPNSEAILSRMKAHFYLIYQHHQRMQFTFHHSYVFLELVPRTVILWTELSCWRKSYSNVITIWQLTTSLRTIDASYCNDNINIVKQWYILRSKACWQTVHHNVGWRTPNSEASLSRMKAHFYL